MANNHYAIDLGTTNSVVAKWNKKLNSPEILFIENICRGKTNNREVDDSFTIPSTVYLIHPSEHYKFPLKFFFKKLKSKTYGLIGREATVKDGGAFNDYYISNFKSYLGKNSYQFIGKLDKWNYTAEDVAAIFLRVLTDQVSKKDKTRISSLTICCPVDFYEFYRAKLKRIAKNLNINKLKFIDEPVAAALGYGLNIEDSKNILVIDFGGGTIDFALIKTEEKLYERGKCIVLAKEGAPIGGNLVDSWIVEDICNMLNYDYKRFTKDSKMRWWYRMLLTEACRVKESLFTKNQETFYLMPTSLMNKYLKIMSRDKEQKKAVDYKKTDLIKLLEDKGLYRVINNLIDSILNIAKNKNIDETGISEVLLVGGSTLLPKIYSTVEKRFGRDKVRAWQPFNAVAYGASAYAAKVFNKSDHITHDYALVTYNQKTLKPIYNTIIPRGTTFPTSRDFWKRQLIPTCALGIPEKIFKLIVCEIGKKHTINQEFLWDEKGDLHMLNNNDNNKQLIIPLNESDPTMGFLNPPHSPSDKSPRVEVSFMINDDKWLCTTVYDLKTKKKLLENRPVVRLK